MRTLFVYIPILVLLCVPRLSLGESGISLLSEQEFRQLSERLSQKVNLFQEVWAREPNAEFVAGTSRDFLYWVKGQFQSVTTREQAMKVQDELLQLERIDVRDFVIGQSDVDIVSNRSIGVSPDQFGVRKIDSISPLSFQTGTKQFQDALIQGYLPTERIRLSKKGFASGTEFGDGVKEIYSGRPTLVPPDDAKFNDTHYAKLKINHQVLLAMRYLRILAVNYFRSHGRRFPGPELFDIDPQSADWVRQTLKKSSKLGALNAYMKQPKFVEWLNGSVQKAFRSYTNPTAAMELFRHFGADKLVRGYNEIQPINQYLFAQPPIDDQVIEQRIHEMGYSPKQIFLDPKRVFPNLSLLHGTRTEAGFLSILREGIVPSSGGAAGAGLYGVSQANKNFAESWGGSKDRTVRFQVSPEARIVDITKGAGKKLFDRFGKKEDEFARHFGVDVIRYPYSPEAFVVKNSSVLSAPRGEYREVVSLSRAADLAKDAHTFKDAFQLLLSTRISGLSQSETLGILELIPYFKDRDDLRKRLQTNQNHDFSLFADLALIDLGLEAMETKAFPEAAEIFGQIAPLFDHLQAVRWINPRPLFERLINQDWVPQSLRRAIIEANDEGVLRFDELWKEVPSLIEYLALLESGVLSKEEAANQALQRLTRTVFKHTYVGEAYANSVAKLWGISLSEKHQEVVHEIGKVITNQRSWKNFAKRLPKMVSASIRSEGGSSWVPTLIITGSLGTLGYASATFGWLGNSEIALAINMGSTMLFGGSAMIGTFVEAISRFNHSLNAKANWDYQREIAQSFTKQMEDSCNIPFSRLSAPSK